MSEPSYRPSPLIELTRARLLEFVRNPGVIFWVFGFPVLLAIVLGIAFRNKAPESYRVAVIGALSADVVNRLSTSDEIKARATERGEALHALKTSKIDLVVKTAGDSPSQLRVIYRLDPTRPNAKQAHLTVDRALQRAYGRLDVIQTLEEQVEEPGGRYIDFLLPGLIGMNIMNSCMWGVGYAVVDARRRKLLKRFAATPMRPVQFLLAFALSRLAFLFAQVVALVVFGYLIFDILIGGSHLTFALVAVMGAFSFFGLALLIAARVESTEVASGWMNFIMLPMWLLSGTFFDYSRFPEVLHPVIRALPLTAMNDGLRLVMTESASLGSLWVELLVMAGWGILGFAIALRTFRWQ